MTRVVLALLLLVAAGCTNALYQGEISAKDAYGKERNFTLYWPKTEPLIGHAKAGPAILLTECSPARIAFNDQAEGIVFRGERGRDRLPGAVTGVDDRQVCGQILGPASLVDAGAGPLEVRIDCEPLPPGPLTVRPRDYLAARPEPYVFAVVEKERTWSFFGKTLAAPLVPECRNP